MSYNTIMSYNKPVCLISGANISRQTVKLKVTFVIWTQTSNCDAACRNIRILGNESQPTTWIGRDRKVGSPASSAGSRAQRLPSRRPGRRRPTSASSSETLFALRERRSAHKRRILEPAPALASSREPAGSHRGDPERWKARARTRFSLW